MHLFTPTIVSTMVIVQAQRGDWKTCTPHCPNMCSLQVCMDPIININRTHLQEVSLWGYRMAVKKKIKKNKEENGENF